MDSSCAPHLLVFSISSVGITVCLFCLQIKGRKKGRREGRRERGKKRKKGGEQKKTKRRTEEICFTSEFFY